MDEPLVCSDSSSVCCFFAACILLYRMSFALFDKPGRCKAAADGCVERIGLPRLSRCAGAFVARWARIFAILF